jgi:predicted ester cyclase
MDIKEFAEKFIKAEDEAWQNGNFGPLEALEDPNVVYRTPPIPDVVGFEAHKQYIMGVSKAMSNLHQEWEYIVGDGNVFALFYKSSGLFTGEMPGLPPPTGKKVTNDGIFVFRLKNGRIVEAWYKGITTGLG